MARNKELQTIFLNDFSSNNIMKLFISCTIVPLLTLNILSVLTVEDFVSTIISQAGYSSDTHNVETEDGFILTLHRLKGKQGESVLLMHGFMQSASVWVYDGPGKSLAFMLKDAGYDVWMLSARGTALSSQHKSLTPNEEKFWDFSFHEIGYYDLPAAIDFILANTSQQQIHYVGHSQGGTVYTVFLAMRPEYNIKIQSSYLLAPATYMANVQGLFSFPLTLGYKYRLEIYELMRKVGINGIILRHPFITNFIATLCQINSYICEPVLNIILGADSGQLDHVRPHFFTWN